MFRFDDYNRDQETAQAKLEYEMFSEQCAEQEEEEELECDGIDCAWCGIVDCPREKNKSQKRLQSK